MHAFLLNQLEVQNEEAGVINVWCERVACVWQPHNPGRRRDRPSQKFGALGMGKLMKRTPDDLTQRPNAMYVSIAIPWCDEPHQQVSRRLLLRSLECGPRGTRNGTKDGAGASQVLRSCPAHRYQRMLLLSTCHLRG